MIQDDPRTFQHGGTEYTGAASGLTRRRPLEIGGFEDQPEMVLIINLRDAHGGEVFPSVRPAVGDRVTVGAKTYRIESTEIDPFEECLQMDLRSKDK